MIDKISIRPIWRSATLNNLPSLNEQEVHVWCLPLALTPTQSSLAHAWLSDIQKDKYARRSSSQQHAYLAGRYFLRGLLGAYTQTEPEKVLLSYSRLNKPYLSEQEAGTKSPTSLHFNFTDTRIDGATYGLFAFSRSGEVGVDIEALSRRSNFAPIVHKRFSAAEKLLVTRENGEIDPELFLCIWTRKEASGKATGQGINFKMQERDLVDGEHAELNFYDELNQPWHLQQLRVNDSLIGCLVHAGHQPLPIKAFNSLET